MKSKADPLRVITSENMVVALVRHGEHALIIAEGLRGGTYFLEVYDFLPTEFVNHSDPLRYDDYYGYGRMGPYHVLASQSIPGTVRIRPLVNAQAMTQREVFDLLHLAEKFRSWNVNFELGEKMRQAIATDRGNPPTFHLAGGSSVFAPAGSHNCITWARSQLAAAGIEFDPSLGTSIADTPSKEIEGGVCAC